MIVIKELTVESVGDLTNVCMNSSGPMLFNLSYDKKRKGV